MKPRRILIAGITGFLGSQLAQRLAAQENVQLVGLHRSNSNLSRLAGIRSQVRLFNCEERNLRSLFASQPFDIVVNCIADYGRQRSPHEVVEANLQLPLQLLDLAVEYRVPMFLNAGTSLPAEVNAYSLSKHQFSEWLRQSSSELVAIDAKLEHFYGAGEDSVRFIRFLIQKFLEPAATLELTKGEQRRDFLHIDDVTSALCLLMEHAADWQNGYHAIPVGSGNAYVLRDVVVLVQVLTGNRDTEIQFGAVPYRDREVMESRADIATLKSLGWHPRWSLEAGLRNTIEQYRMLVRERKSA